MACSTEDEGEAQGGEVLAPASRERGVREYVILSGCGRTGCIHCAARRTVECVERG